MMMLTASELRNLGRAVFADAKVSRENAESVVEALLAAELDGIATHGFARIPFYADQSLCSKINGYANPQVTISRPSMVLADACNGFAFPAIEAGLHLARQQAESQGICALGVTRSHHCGALGYFMESMANAGFIAIGFANSPASMAPWGGHKSIYGTNPIAFGCPQASAPPIVVDLALSKVARGNVVLAKQRGTAIPEGWAIDAEGNPTTNAEAALAGTMLPLGDAKGAALALMVEILTATLTGANHSFESTSFLDTQGDPPGTGQFFLLIDPKGFHSSFLARLSTLCQEILSQEGTRLPGQRRFELRAKNQAEGIQLPDALLADLKKRAGL